MDAEKSEKTGGSDNLLHILDKERQLLSRREDIIKEVLYIEGIYNDKKKIPIQ
jgi:hypothetical protein